MKWVVISVLALLAPVVASCRPETTPPATPPEPAAPVAWAADGVINDGEYQGGVGESGYEIFWRLDGDDILIGMRAETNGWVAVGFQPQPDHRMSDTIIGNVTDEGAAVFDMYSTEEFGPCVLDIDLGGSDDILDSGGRETDGVTVIEFRRALTTNDTYDGALVSGPNEVIWAYSNTDDVVARHLDRGRLEIPVP